MKIPFFVLLCAGMFVSGRAQTWQNLNSGTSQLLTHVHFLHPDTGYFNGTALFKTSNGGSTWSQIGACPGDVTMWSQQTGLSTGTGISKTTNGGTSWNSVFSDSRVAYIPEIQMLNASTGFATAIASGFDSTLLVKTTDGGNTWQIRGGFPDFATASFLHFLNQDTGFIASDGMNAIYKTTDGGINWTLNYGGPATIYYADIFFIDNNRGWACGAGGLIHTSNGGNSWTVQGNFSSGIMYSVKFVNANRGFIVGGNGVSTGYLYETTNGGTTWTQTQAHSQTFHSLSFPSTSIGYTVGSSGTALKYGGSPSGIIYHDLSAGIYQDVENELIQITLPEFLSTADLSVFNISGALIQRENYQKSNPTISTANLPAGIYLLRIASGEQVYSGKFVISR